MNILDIFCLNHHHLMSHINSVPRESLKGKTPYEETLTYINKEILDKLNIIKIEPDKVSLSQIY